MSLSSLTIQDFRNIESAELALSPTLNLIFGQNGSGKTSLLEAINYLSSAHSFRTQNVEALIRHEEKSFIIAASLFQHGHTIRVGLRRSRRQVLRRINQETIKRQIQLTQLLPVRVLHPDSHKLVSDSPRYRRSYLDWGCFYFHKDFYQIWAATNTVLKQRNALLKNGNNQRVLDALDQEYVRLSEQLDAIRAAYISELLPILKSYADQLLVDKAEVAIEYERGWKHNLNEQLHSDSLRDRKFKRTHSGPHRADIKITYNQIDARQNASRGQQKLIVVLLTLGQIHYFKQNTDISGILLIDDLPSELDADHQNRFVTAVKDLNQQTFITAIDPSGMDLSHWQERRMFHVKHGCFTEVV
jgi:DNA replication and repair protein RecF